MIVLKPCSYVYFPDDFEEFMKVLLLEKGHIGIFFKSLLDLMRGKKISNKDTPRDVVLVLMHVISYHNSCLDKIKKLGKEADYGDV